MKSRTGFTLVEVMAVVIILSIITGVAIPKFFAYQDLAREAACKGVLSGVRAGVANFYANEAINSTSARYPTMTELTDGSTMQETIPDNPYNSGNGVASTNAADAVARNIVGVTDGWRYYVDNSLPTPAKMFYANTKTTGVNENSF